MAAHHEYRLRQLAARKVRKRKTVLVILPDRKAKGSSRNFHKPHRAARKPVLGDRISTTEAALWLAPTNKYH